VIQPAIDPEAFRRFEADGWQQVSDVYDRLFGPVTAHVLPALLDAAGVARGTRVLDVASGPGYVAARAAERGALVVGIDVAPAMVGLASRLHPELDFRQAPAEAPPFADGAFDAVVSNFGLGHFAEPERVAARLARMLAPGGRLALSWWDVPAKCRFLGLIVDAMTEAGATPPPDLPAGPPIFRYSEDVALTELLGGAGLVGIDIRSVAFVHPFPAPDALWDGMLAGTVRISAAIRRQPAAIRERIRASFDRLAVPHLRPDGLAVPVSVKLVPGRKDRS
jgi:SAM-dependent methyltransferase